MSTKIKQKYSKSILDAFEHCLSDYPEAFVMGQGLWSPWYVGSTMDGLDKKFGKDRVIDTPVSEAAVTGAGVGASLCGMKPIIVHPRMDFMLYAMDPIVNQAAKWSLMTGGQSHPGITIRAIINRGGEQGAQHSQALHSWFSHVPGLRVVMPYSVKDARDLLIASVICPDPVLYIDDRWLYDEEDEIELYDNLELKNVKPSLVCGGSDITIVGCGYTTKLCVDANTDLQFHGINSDIIDLRVLNPLDPEIIIDSVNKTGRLIVVDGGWKTCGIAGEIISSVCENLDPHKLKSKPKRVTLPFAAAPTATNLEKVYYPNADIIKNFALKILNINSCDK